MIFAKLMLLLGLSGLMFGAQAASFNCDKAASQVEKMICADQTLSNLDSSLSFVYSKTIFRSDKPAAVKTAQLSWLKNVRNVCITVECVQIAYRQRLIDLRAIPVMYPNLDTAIDRTCREMAGLESPASPGTCRLSKAASFGSLDGTVFHYAIYCLGNPPSEQGIDPCGISGMALFAQNKDTGVVRMFHDSTADFGSSFYAPSIDTNKYGTLLTSPVHISGTGDFNDNRYFIRRKNQWVLMDTQSWLVDLNQRIPTGLEIWKGVEPDMDSLTAQANLYRRGDGNCCPTGGTATVDLGIAGNRLTIKSVRIEPHKTDSQ